jgi:hypothetical protein
MVTRPQYLEQVGSSSVFVHMDQRGWLMKSWCGREGMSLRSLTVKTDTGGRGQYMSLVQGGQIWAGWYGTLVALTAIGRSP